MSNSSEDVFTLNGDVENVIHLVEEDNGESERTAAMPAPTAASESVNRMSYLTAACKKYEFIPFSKDGNTVFVKFDLDLDRGSVCGAAPFVIKLLAEGYWTLYVFGRRLHKQHPVYPMFSLATEYGPYSRNYKLDIARTEELFAYLKEASVCVGNPEFFQLCRKRKVGQSNEAGLTAISLSDGSEVSEVVRRTSWKDHVYPSTLVHKNCQLIRPRESAEDLGFRCQPCARAWELLSALNDAAVSGSTADRAQQTGESVPGVPAKKTRLASPAANVPAKATDNVGSRARDKAPVAPAGATIVHLPGGPRIITTVNPNSIPRVAPAVNSHPSPGIVPAGVNANPGPVKTNSVPAPVTLIDPIYLRAKNESGRHFIFRDSNGVFSCGLCNYRFPDQKQKVTFNEHLWTKHHVFIDSLSLWCDGCHKPFFDNARLNAHVKKEHAPVAAA